MYEKKMQISDKKDEIQHYKLIKRRIKRLECDKEKRYSNILCFMRKISTDRMALPLDSSEILICIANKTEILRS